MELDWFICPLKSQLNALGYRKCTQKTEINADDITLEVLEKNPQDANESNRALDQSPGEPWNHLDIRSSREEVCLLKLGLFRDAGFSVALHHQTSCPRVLEPGWQSVHQLMHILVQLLLYMYKTDSLAAPDVGPLSAPARLVSFSGLALRERLVHILKNGIWWDSSEDVFDNLGPPDPFLSLECEIAAGTFLQPHHPGDDSMLGRDPFMRKDLINKPVWSPKITSCREFSWLFIP